MSIEDKLLERSGSKCELCSSTDDIAVYEVPPNSDGSIERSLLICSTCSEQIENPDKLVVNHWRCLTDSMWSEVPAVKVLVWRMLDRLRSEGWTADLLDMLYLDDETLKWAQSKEDKDDQEEAIKHIDSNGDLLQSGDSVILIKDLNVKGANFTTKRGTAVRRISLVHDNAEQIEGKVNGQHIVILTQFVKKSS